MESINFIYRRLGDSEIPDGVKDTENIFANSTWKIDILRRNPFLNDKELSVFQILGLLDNEIVGSETHFPIILQLDNEEYPSLSGHGLSVSSKSRGLGLGTRLTDQRLDFSQTNSLLLCDASQMHLPILKKLGAIVFLMPRMIMLKHSFSVIENKTNRAIAKWSAPIIDKLLMLPFMAAKIRIRKIKKRLNIVELERIPNEVEHIISKDSHRFKEKHTLEWFNWVKNNALVEDKTMIKKFFGVYRDDKLVGFFMTKKRFYQQASHRGYKNVVLGSIMEWGTIDEGIVNDNELCLMAIMSFDNTVDAIELCCPDENSAKFFKRFGIVQIGEGNVVVRYRNNSPLSNINELSVQSNWRLRPAMGDNSLS